MANTYIQMFVHMVFSTKRRTPSIKKSDFAKLHQYMRTVLESKQCPVVMVGGVENHVHLLFQLGKGITISNAARFVKSNSSKWLKEIDKDYGSFAWQDGYSAFSVSKSVVPKVKRYIANQESHHSNQFYEDELKHFLDLQEIKYDDRYIFD